jgi:uncharacterized membrane protein
VTIDWIRIAPLLLAVAGMVVAAAWIVRRWPRLWIPVGALPVLVGGLIAYSALAAAHGYAAAYSFAGAWAYAAFLGIAGVVLLLIRRSRRAGICGLAAAAMLLVSFYAVYLTGYAMGLCTWKEKTRITVGSR